MKTRWWLVFDSCSVCLVLIELRCVVNILVVFSVWKLLVKRVRSVFICSLVYRLVLLVVMVIMVLDRFFNILYSLVNICLFCNLRLL